MISILACRLRVILIGGFALSAAAPAALHAQIGSSGVAPAPAGRAPHPAIGGQAPAMAVESSPSPSAPTAIRPSSQSSAAQMRIAPPTARLMPAPVPQGKPDSVPLPGQRLNTSGPSTPGAPGHSATQPLMPTPSDIKLQR